jgi:hypothetical protein
MRPFLWYLWLASAVQLLILLANIPLPKKLRCRENLARVSPMIRAVFIVHWALCRAGAGNFYRFVLWLRPGLGGREPGRTFSLGLHGDFLAGAGTHATILLRF